MGWDSAIKQRAAPAATGWASAKPRIANPSPPPPDPPEPQEPEYTHDDYKLVQLYKDALRDLAEQQPKYRLNRQLFRGWDMARRLHWIDRIEQDARDGKNTLGVEVVTCAMMLRLD